FPTNRKTSLGMRRSASKPIAEPAPAAAISWAASSACACLRAMTATRAPSRTNASAIALPMPLVAPVTATTLSLNPISIFALQIDRLKFGDQSKSRNHQQTSGDAQERRRVLFEAEPPIVVHEHREDQLARHDEPDQGSGSKLWGKQNVAG